MTFLGSKSHILYNEFISGFIPENINDFIYVEPFGGSFALPKYFTKKPKRLIYNDINCYDINIEADEYYYEDYKIIFDNFDDVKTFFYLDPPYYGKEQFYDGCTSKNDKFHIELKESISKLKGNFILSYESCPFILDLYSDFKIHNYSGNTPYYAREIIITR